MSEFYCCPQSLKVNGDNLKLFAWASGDHNPIHQDEAIAKGMGLDGVIAHGMYFYSWALFQVEKYSLEKFKEERVISDLQMRFYKPALIGDELKLLIQEKESDGFLKWQCELQNQDKEKVAVLKLSF